MTHPTRPRPAPPPPTWARRLAPLASVSGVLLIVGAAALTAVTSLGSLVTAAGTASADTAALAVCSFLTLYVVTFIVAVRSGDRR